MNQSIPDPPLSRLPPRHVPGEAIGPAQDWLLDRLLGRGAFSEVWLAHDRQGANAPRALKIFTGAGAAEWLGRRQDALWTIMHKLWGQPHVVRLLDIGLAGPTARTDGTGGTGGTGGRAAAQAAPSQQPFVAMEYVPGGSLEDWILTDPEHRPPLQKQEVLRGVVSALAAAHRQGIYHGGLRPSRILLTRPPRESGKPAAGPRPEVEAKVAGFGLAGPGASVMGADRTYEPPEAWAAGAGWDPAGDDVFALGVVWYQLLAGKIERPPYDFADVLADAGQGPHTIGLVARCLARPGRRFASAAELDEAFGEVGLPVWPPVPAKCFDVSQIVREYLRTREGA